MFCNHKGDKGKIASELQRKLCSTKVLQTEKNDGLKHNIYDVCYFVRQYVDIK